MEIVGKLNFHPVRHPIPPLRSQRLCLAEGMARHSRCEAMSLPLEPSSSPPSMVGKRRAHLVRRGSVSCVASLASLCEASEDPFNLYFW